MRETDKVFNLRYSWGGGVRGPKKVAGVSERGRRRLRDAREKRAKFTFFFFLLRLLCDNSETYNSDGRLFKFNVRKTYFFFSSFLFLFFCFTSFAFSFFSSSSIHCHPVPLRAIESRVFPLYTYINIVVTK